ncbi:hypothetical protein SAMN05444280_11473 [Tangfeifania diversioriginum]|uniref:Uncharacterized protein n=1 Tax=Tangfeifania diversioriginum TaxID=1168035 RepID=A0A1M6HSV8_9BACT|nr:hypothetical protein SAMN05444280_11473 [Tangfeifania diversioriginum]
MPLVESKIKALIFSELELSNFLISFVEQLPRRIQITFGGNPQKATSLGDRFWSNRSFITRKVQSFLCLQHSSNMQVCLLFPNLGNHQEFLQNSFLKQGSLRHQLQLSAFPLRRVSHFFSPVLMLFFHLATWLLFYSKILKTSKYDLVQH